MGDVVQLRPIPDDLFASEWAHILRLEVRDLEDACKNFDGYPNTCSQGDAMLYLSRIKDLVSRIENRISKPIN
jgi:hypothetical protein